MKGFNKSGIRGRESKKPFVGFIRHDLPSKGKKKHFKNVSFRKHTRKRKEQKRKHKKVDA